MRTYEINVWEDKMVVEKVIRQFENDEAVTDYIQKRWDTEIKPRLDTEKGKLRPKAQDMIITWAKISTYVRRRGPKRLQLTDDEKKLQKQLERSINRSAIDEWGMNEMIRYVQKNYGPNPDATGYNEFPGRKPKTYIDGLTGKKYTKENI
jgi:hypothetical protein